MKSFKARLIIVLVSVLLILTAFVSFMPSVHGAEPTITEKSLLILEEVAGFNMTAYTPSLMAAEQDAFLTLPQEEADLILTSSQGRLRASCSFVDGRLRRIFISDVAGEVSLKQPAADALASATGFLERYQSYTSDAFYGELRSMLDAVSAGENDTETEGSVQLKVSVVGQDWTDFTWTYVDENGVPAVSKNVVLSYRDGMLKMFLDNWRLYSIAAEPVLSSEEAVAIALDAAEGYSWTVENTEKGTVTVSDFKIVAVGDASLCYLNYPDSNAARGGDPFTLYPSWYVPLGFDRVYPGGVSGVTVRVWADTGEVSGIGYMVIGGAGSPAESQPAAQAQEQVLMLPIPFAMIIIVGATILYFVHMVRILRLKGTQKQVLKLFSISLCLIVGFGSVLTLVSPAGAYPPDNLKSRIYASLYDQIAQEQSGADAVCDMLEYMFSNAGYNTNNHFGSETTRNIILANTEDDEDDFDYVAVFHFGHMYGANRYQGNNGGDSGDYVSYTDIAPLTEGKTFFVWMWTCMSAQDWPYCTGLPSAWTDNADMSNNAYFSPDTSGNCYIGFSGASPTLNNCTGSFKNYAGALGMDFITWFYYFALVSGRTIKDALDLASSEVFSKSYGCSPLYEGFETWWPVDFGPGMGPDWYNGTMRVFGNGNIRLTMCSLTVYAFGWNGQFYTNDNADVWVDGQYAGSTNFMYLTKPVGPGNHTVEVGSEAWGGDFRLFAEHPWYENPITVYTPMYSLLGTDTLVYAYYFPLLTLNISATTGGTTDPSGTQYHAPLNTTYVTATPDEDHVFDRWLKNGGYAGSNPTIEVYMDASYTLQAVFRDPLVTVLARDQYGNPVQATVNVYIDGNPVGTAGSSFSVTSGQHTLQVSVPGGCTFQNFTYPGGSNASNPMAFTVAGDMTVTAYFTLPHYWLTVYATDGQSSVPTEVYVDGGQWAGMAGDSFLVPAGDHSVSVEGIVYGGYGEEWWFYFFDGYGLGENPVSASVCSDTELTAYYWRCP